ncbi:MAG TPA: serine hydrolase [Terriglobales bacterium]|jgi:beta-lactamase class A|nr:serine hydrolase [Terriglobales bacterium]
MRQVLIILMLASTAWAADLQKQLDKAASRFHGKVTLYAINMKTGDTVELNADEPVQTASVIKLPVMVEVFAEVAAGKRSLQDKLVLTRENQVPGSGILAQLQPGLELTLYDAVVLMMDLSDNTATNVVIDHIGIPAVNTRIKAMGLKDTYLYKKVFKPAEGPMPPDQAKFGLGKTTAREMAEVMQSVEGCAAGAKPPSHAPANWNGVNDPGLCRQMIEIMRNQQQNRNMIPHYLETIDTSDQGSAIADKPGELDDVRADVAVVYSKSGPIVISAFTYDNKDQTWTAENEAELLLARMARLIVNTWSPAGLEPPKGGPASAKP